MTKLEEKLFELDYEKSKNPRDYFKRLKGRLIIYIYIFQNNELSAGVYQEDSLVIEQNQINRLQQAFDEMQRDLEILKGVLEDD